MTFRVQKYFLFFLLLCLLCNNTSLAAKEMEGIYGELILRTFPFEAKLFEEHTPITPQKIREEWKIYKLKKGYHHLQLRAEGYVSKDFRFVLEDTLEIEEKLERANSYMKLVGETPTGIGPKSVLFHPTASRLLVTQLMGKGFDVIPRPDLYPRKAITLGSQTGWVEFCVLNQKRELWVSQMLTNEVYVLDLDTLRPKISFPIEGVWPKVICTDTVEQFAYVSNWESKSISVVDISKKKVVEVIPVSGVPRGLAYSPSGVLYVCLFEPGGIDVIDTRTRKRVRTLPMGEGATRHIVLDPQRQFAYISDMATGRVTKLSLFTEKSIASLRVGSNPNTLVLSSDGRYLFVSVRGKNNAEDYQKKGPEFGKIVVLDTDTFQVIDWVWGRNQPTGLAISPDNRYLAFTDFLDNNLEVYDISGLTYSNYPLLEFEQ